MDSATERLRALLVEKGVAFAELVHEPTLTSEDAARARNERIDVGAKSLVMKAGTEWCLFVVPGNAKIDSGAVKRFLRPRGLRFATVEELHDLTGLVPGSVPPFGRPILPLHLFADPTVGVATGRVAFNAASLTHSFVMTAKDWRCVAAPTEFSFVKPELAP